MSFEAFYLTFRLATNQQAVEDAMVVCDSKRAMQSALDGLGCRSVAELPAKLRSKCAAMQADFGPAFLPFFRWLFEMGKAISALNHDLAVDRVRTVPQQEGLLLMEAALVQWPLMPTLKAFCTDKHGQPFTKDNWTQIGRFVHMTRTGKIAPDLANYDDDSAGGGAWPVMIDEFGAPAARTLPHAGCTCAPRAHRSLRGGGARLSAARTVEYVQGQAGGSA